MTLFIAAQIVGAISAVIFTISLLLRKQSKILLFHLFGIATEGIMYFLQFAITGGVLRCIDIVRTGIMYIYKSKNKRMPGLLVAVFSVVALVIGIYTWENIWSIFVIVPALIYTPAMWQNNMRITRFSMLAICISLTVYNFAVGIYTAGVGLVIQTIAAVIAVVRFEVIGNGHKVNRAE